MKYFLNSKFCLPSPGLKRTTFSPSPTAAPVIRSSSKIWQIFASLESLPRVPHSKVSFCRDPPNKEGQPQPEDLFLPRSSLKTVWGYPQRNPESPPDLESDIKESKHLPVRLLSATAATPVMSIVFPPLCTQLNALTYFDRNFFVYRETERCCRQTRSMLYFIGKKGGEEKEKTEVKAGRLCTRCCQVGDFRKVGFAGEEHHTCFCVWKIHSDFYYYYSPE